MILGVLIVMLFVGGVSDVIGRCKVFIFVVFFYLFFFVGFVLVFNFELLVFFCFIGGIVFCLLIIVLLYILEISVLENWGKMVLVN